MARAVILPLPRRPGQRFSQHCRPCPDSFCLSQCHARLFARAGCQSAGGRYLPVKPRRRLPALSRRYFSAVRGFKCRQGAVGQQVFLSSSPGQESLVPSMVAVVALLSQSHKGRMPWLAENVA